MYFRTILPPSPEFLCEATSLQRPIFIHFSGGFIRPRNIYSICVFIGERVANLKELETNKFVASQIVKTNKREIECDMVVPCIGTKINNEFFKDELGKF